MHDAAWQDRYFASADGLRLHYRDYAAAQGGRLPVLCLPGLTRNCRDFETTALRLQSRRRVLGADLRGRGASQYDPDWRNYHPGTYVADLARLLDDAGVERAILLGTSLGGILSMLICASAPQRVAAVILNDIGPEVAQAGLQRIANYVGRAAPDLWPVFAALQPFPALALRGELSDVLSESTFARMAREKPDLRCVTVAQRGHPPMLDEPESVAGIDDFLDRLP